MRVEYVKLENFRCVPNGKYDLNGKSVLLMADNMIGKTHFMNAIRLCLGKILPGPGAIMEGMEEAKIEVKTADYNVDMQPIPGTDYHFRTTIRTSKKGEQVVELEVTLPNGIIENKKTLIGTLVGEFELQQDFVALSKTDSGRKEQLEIIKSYFSEATRTALRLEEQRIGIAYKERTDLSRDIKKLEGSVALMKVNPSDLVNFKEPKITAELITKREVITGKNQTIQGVIDRNLLRAGSIAEGKDKVEKLRMELLNAETALKKLEEEAVQAEQYLKDNLPQSTEQIDAEIQGAEAHNQKCREVAEYNKQATELASLKAEWEGKEVFINAGRQAIADAIRDAEFPIPGVTYTPPDEGLNPNGQAFYNGKQIHPDFMSTAEIKMFHARLVMAAMKAKEQHGGLLFIAQGESIGSDFMDELYKECEKDGFQIIMEEVKRGQKELKVKIMGPGGTENGEIAVAPIEEEKE